MAEFNLGCGEANTFRDLVWLPWEPSSSEAASLTEAEVILTSGSGIARGAPGNIQDKTVINAKNTKGKQVTT